MPAQAISPTRNGPLAGLKIVEMGSIGPGPMCAMFLADLGATVLRVERPGGARGGMQRPVQFDLLLRNRHSISLDLKSEAGRAVLQRLIDEADGLIEGFRPGAMERLGFAPDVCLERNASLVYGRMTGWGQDGPLAQVGAHDLNYVGLTGVLHAIGRASAPPSIPLNLLGDYAGGGLYLALGMLAAMLEAGRSGRGQVVDAAIVDGAAHLATMFYGMSAAGMLNPERGANLLDSGAPHYDVYRCADGQWLAVAPVESHYYATMLATLEIDPATLPDIRDRSQWGAIQQALAAVFAGRSRDAWCALFADVEACVSPVLSWDEAKQHPHTVARSTFVDVDGVVQPRAAPRFSRTDPATPTAPRPCDSDVDAALSAWLPARDVAELRRQGALK